MCVCVSWTYRRIITVAVWTTHVAGLALLLLVYMRTSSKCHVRCYGSQISINTWRFLKFSVFMIRILALCLKLRVWHVHRVTVQYSFCLFLRNECWAMLCWLQNDRLSLCVMFVSLLHCWLWRVVWACPCGRVVTALGRHVQYSVTC